MKIPQNLPRFSDYTREEALRLLLEKEYGCPPPQPDTLEFHVVRREEDAFAGKAVHATVEAWARGGAFPSPFTWCAPRQASPCLGWCFSTSPPLCRTPTCPPRSCATWDWRWPPSTAGTSPRTTGISPPKPGACSRWTEACPPPRESWPCGPGAPAWCGSTWPPAPRLTKRPWLWRAIPAWARPRCWPAPWTSASSLCSPTSPAAPAPPCTGASRGRPPRTSSGCSPIGSAPASPAAPGTQSSSPLTSTSCCPSSPPGSCTFPARRKTSGPTPPRSCAMRAPQVFLFFCSFAPVLAVGIFLRGRKAFGGLPDFQGLPAAWGASFRPRPSPVEAAPFTLPIGT